jgi:hypothetical protein
MLFWLTREGTRRIRDPAEQAANADHALFIAEP